MCRSWFSGSYEQHACSVELQGRFIGSQASGRPAESLRSAAARKRHVTHEGKQSGGLGSASLCGYESCLLRRPLAGGAPAAVLVQPKPGSNLFTAAYIGSASPS